jgi:hypothetical protein
MIPSRAVGPQSAWIANAQRLHQAGHFATYSSRQRNAVLKNGFIGRWRPDDALRIAREQVEIGISVKTEKFIREMRDHFHLVGDEMRAALLQILAGIPPESYEPPSTLQEPPGCPFVFHCKRLDCKVYLKFQVDGAPKKPRVIFWSCHPPIY